MTSGGALHCCTHGQSSGILAVSTSSERGIAMAFCLHTCLGLQFVGRVVAWVRDGVSLSWPLVSLVSRKSYPLMLLLVGQYILHRNKIL